MFEASIVSPRSYFITPIIYVSYYEVVCNKHIFLFTCGRNSDNKK